MKVLNFLEWYQTGEITVDENNTDSLADIQLKQSAKLGAVALFYSQPFKPEMIAELFEGWTKGGDFANQLIEFGDGHANHFSIETHWDINGDWSVAKYLKHCSEHRTTAPITLDVFISDCQRAGIELEWKPEIVDKYFRGAK